LKFKFYEGDWIIIIIFFTFFGYEVDKEVWIMIGMKYGLVGGLTLVGHFIVNDLIMRKPAASEWPIRQH
jgi:hypothetical protein